MSEIIGAGILFLISISVFIVSIRSFLEKGYLFNNAYLYASEQEREKMNKKPYYRQSAVVFFAVGLIFFLNGLNVLLQTDWILYFVITIVVLTLIYAIVSSVSIAKHNK